MNMNLAKESIQLQQLAAVNEIATLTKIIAGGWKLSDWKAVQAIVQAGLGPKYYPVGYPNGTQFTTTWSDGTNTYDFPFDVVAHQDVTVLENGVEVTKPGMILQAHYLSPAVQFDAQEAFYVVEDETLPAGTYSFTLGVKLSNNAPIGTVFSFTTTQAAPSGTQFVFTTSDPETAAVNVYASASATTPVESGLTLTKNGAAGTSLGTLTSPTLYGTSGLNDINRARYGYNRYTQSAQRQQINSSAATGAWWEPKNPFDRPPSQLASVRGLLAGFPEDFLSVIQATKVTTALNTVTDTAIGTQESVYDRFFLPSLEQEYCVPQAAGVEGAYWPYWKERLGLSSPQQSGSTYANAEHIRYALENHNSAQTARLRSASRGNAFNTRYVSSGYVSDGYATGAYRPPSACAIC